MADFQKFAPVSPLEGGTGREIPVFFSWLGIYHGDIPGPFSGALSMDR